MRALMLMLAVAMFLPSAAVAQADSGPAADVLAIHRLIHRYARAVHTVDPELLGRIWSHSPEVSFIYPLGEERGFEAIERNVFEKVLGGQFSARDLQMDEVAVHVNGDSAWSEFHGVSRHAAQRRKERDDPWGGNADLSARGRGVAHRACALFGRRD
jgi:hypothetical protein